MENNTKPRSNAVQKGSIEKGKKPKRRAVACKSCHSLKVKCIPSDTHNSNSPCTRCLKTKRVCEIDPPQERKKKKPEERVAELELRLEQLTSQLHQSGSPASQTSDQSSIAHSSPRSQPQSQFGSFQSYSPHIKQNVSTARSSLVPQRPPPMTPVGSAGENVASEEQKRARQAKAQLIEEKFGPKKLHDISSAVTSANQIRVSALTMETVDIIQAGFITEEEARIRLDVYQNVIYKKYPFVCVSDEFDVLRKEHTVLFNSLMAIVGMLRPTDGGQDIHTNLEIFNLSQKQLLNEIMFIGNKSMDLLKSLLLQTIWYNAPEMFHHRRYHIFSGLCISLCHDLGLTGRPYYVVNKSDGAFRRSMVLEEPQKEEYRSLVLTVYCLSTSYMLFLRRKLPVTWSPYLEECCHLLRASSDLRYKTIGVLAKLTSLMEKVDTFISNQDQENHPLINYFVQEIAALKSEPTNLETSVMNAFACSIEAFLYSRFSSQMLSLKCLQATMECIETFATMSVEEMNSVPLMIFGRLMYCFALFLKTSNVLKYDFDLEFTEKLLDKMRICSETYKNNHIVLKIRLLLHFYLTTFAKNEDVFNSINEVSSTYSIAKTVSEASNAMRQHQARSFQQHPEMRPSNSTSSLPNMLNGDKPHSDPFHPSLSQQLPTDISSNGMMGSSQVQMRPGFISDTNLPQPMANNVPIDPFGTAAGTHGLMYQNSTNDFGGDATFPRLDMLSDATTKGFLDVPNDLLTSQDEFWRLFDYKQDDQFYL